MVKLILVLLIGFVGLYAKSSVGACIPIGQIVVLKKSIMRLDLNKEQKKKLLKYENKLKNDLSDMREKAFAKDERLSSMFDKKSFLKKKFADIAKEESDIATNSISEYFEKMYNTLTDKQRIELIKRFKRMEKKRNKDR